MSRDGERAARVLIPLGVFAFFLCLYWLARFSEGAEDAANVGITVTNNLLDGTPRDGTLRHHFPVIFMFYWNHLLSWLGVGTTTCADPNQARYVLTIVRSTWMNGLFGAGTVALSYLYAKRIAGGVRHALLVAAVVGFASGTWLLSTCAEISPPGRFFLLLGLLATLGTHRSALLGGWPALVLSAMFSGLALLCHAPLEVFLPLLLVSALYHRFPAENLRAWLGQLRQWPAMATAALVWILGLEVFIRLVSPYSLLSFAGLIFAHVREVLAGQESVDLYSRHSLASVLNITMAMVSVLTNWIGTTGTQTFDPRPMVQFGWKSVLGYAFSAVLFAGVAYAFVLGWQMARRRAAEDVGAQHPSPRAAFYLYLSLAWCVTGALALYQSNYGVTTEHWTPVLLGTAPVLALVWRMRLRPMIAGALWISALGLGAVNFAQAYPYVRLNPDQRLAYHSQVYAASFDLADRTSPKDAVITYGLHPTYWVTATTAGRRTVTVIDAYTTAGIQSVVAAAQRQGGRVYVVEELFQPDEKTSAFVRANLSSAAWQAVAWLRSHYHATGLLETTPFPFRFVEVVPAR